MELTETIEAIHRRSHGTYGSPRIHVELREDHGIRVGRKRVARLMKEAGLEGVHRRRNKNVKDAKPKREVFEDLLEREFTADAPDRVYVADITSHETEEGWLHLAAVMDLFHKEIVGWSMATHLRGELVIQSLEMAIGNRQPPVGVVHHSDHGSQYTSLAFGKRLEAEGLLGSMGSVGDCFDNAAMESFFATLQTELLDRQSWQTISQLRTAIFEFIATFYNRRRRHSSLDYLSPAEYERRYNQQQATA